MNQFIKERNELTEKISDYWNIIATENVVKKTYIRNYDLEKVILTIIELYKRLIIVKLQLQCLNMGIKYEDLSPEANIRAIYCLGVYRELVVKLNEMKQKHTINENVKRKLGLKNMSVTEALTSSYFRNMIERYTIEVNKYQKLIAEFNVKT
jgi:hypothetical protein